MQIIKEIQVIRLTGSEPSGGFWDLSSRLPTGMEDERLTVEETKGFYIARYETGTGVVSKKGYSPITNIICNDSIARAKSFINNKYVKSTLISGIEWDVTMSFVNGKQANGGTFKVTQSNALRHRGSKGLTGANEYDKVCNIYDLEDNCYERTTEREWHMFSGERLESWISRGGSYNQGHPASYRFGWNDWAESDTGFRMVLYVMK